LAGRAPAGRGGTSRGWMSVRDRLNGLLSGSGGSDALKNGLRAIWQDLRAKRLWPVALVLALALVAVPVLLSKSAKTSPPPPAAPAPTPAVAGLPAVNQSSVPVSV